MNVNEMFPSRFVKGSDLKGPSPVTIERVVRESMYKPGEGRIDGWVMYCKGATRGVVLTRPLAMLIASILVETDTDKWSGRQVVLFPEAMRVAGRDIVAIRAKAAPVPAAATQAAGKNGAK